MVWAVAILGVGAALGFTLADLGWRRRATDGHPHCFGCGFDLFGLPAESGRCPECGEGVSRSSVRWKRRRGLLFAGCVVVLVSVAGGGAGIWLRWDQFDVVEHLPVWALLLNVRYGPEGWAKRSSWHLTRDAYQWPVEDELCGRYARAVLDRPGSGREFADPMLLSAFLVHMESSADPLREKLIAPLAELPVAFRPRVRAGDPLPVRLNEYVPSEFQPLHVRRRVLALKVGGKDLLFPGQSLHQCPEAERWTQGGGITLAPSVTRDLPLGQTAWEAVVEVTCISGVFHQQRFSHTVAGRLEVVAAGGPVLGVRPRTSTRPFDEFPPPVRQVLPAPGYLLQFRLMANQAPNNFCKATLQWRGRSWPLKVWTGSVGTTEMSLGKTLPPGFDVAESRVLIEPDPYSPAAARTVEWAEVPGFRWSCAPEPMSP